MEDNLMTLTTEERNPRTMDMSHMEAGEIAAVMNEEDYRCAAAVKEALPQIGNVIDTCISTISGGGRVFFIGAAHSGYLGLLDGYETNATFGTENQFIPIVAGHFSDIMKTEGGAEDSAESGKADLEAYGIDEKDYCIGLSASGRTPYPIGALTYARKCGT
ncbi:SIS domain-containing protein [Hungatella effluvii]|nr:SIS domain-containing protein [Hungatella effluvii]